MLKKGAQEKQILDQLKKIENSAQQCVASIELCRETTKEIQVEFII